MFGAMKIGIWGFDGIPAEVMFFGGIVSTFVEIGIRNKFRKIQTGVVGKYRGGDKHDHLPFKIAGFFFE